MFQNDFLFHGSTQLGLKYIIPTPYHARTDKSQPLVFASRYKAMASCYLLPCDASWCRVFFDQNGRIFFVTNDADRLEQSDQGGSIYTLAAQGFVHDPYKGMGYMEWMADTPQKVLQEESFDRAVGAMRLNGVKLITVSDSIFNALVEHSNGDVFKRLLDQEMDAMHDYLMTHAREKFAA